MQPVEVPLLRSKLVAGGQHVLVLGSPHEPPVRAVVESLQSDGYFAVTLASGYAEATLLSNRSHLTFCQQAVSAVAEYNFNAIVLPRGKSRNLEIARVVLALKCRYRGQLRPEREGKLVDQINSKLTPRCAPWLSAAESLIAGPVGWRVGAC